VKVFVSRSTFQPAATRRLYGGNAIYCGGIRAIDSEPRGGGGGAQKSDLSKTRYNSVIVVLCFLSADRCAKRDAEREKNARAGERDAEPFSLANAYAISPGGRSVRRSLDGLGALHSVGLFAAAQQTVCARLCLAGDVQCSAAVNQFGRLIFPAVLRFCTFIVGRVNVQCSAVRLPCRGGLDSR